MQGGRSGLTEPTFLRQTILSHVSPLGLSHRGLGVGRNTSEGCGLAEKCRLRPTFAQAGRVGRVLSIYVCYFLDGCTDMPSHPFSGSREQATLQL